MRRVRLRQQPEALAAQRAGGGHDADAAVAGQRGGRLDARLDADDAPVRVALAQCRGRRRGGGVAGDDEDPRLLRLQELGQPERAVADVGVAAFAVRRVARVGHVEQLGAGQPLPDGPQHRQPAQAGIEDADARRGGTGVGHGGRKHRARTGAGRQSSSASGRPRCPAGDVCGCSRGQRGWCDAANPAKIERSCFFDLSHPGAARKLPQSVAIRRGPTPRISNPTHRINLENLA